ncbi:tail tube GTA-gp10-like protein [Methylosinus sp. sav-2]|uniref:GTA-gp10 family protein n=1 Tax=Methylosinus sp. sav-2 TaxID=2485168 RepID=UPI000691FB02|nr:GTA-gp10 family protein [Methylosinus sp. sav-2]TDX61924.1 tail tube GTA-gp10-like protein [Methylosinus sp. sav-2]
MANKVRGAVSLQLGEERLDVTLGLGALAEIEDAFEVESFEQAPLFSGRGVSARLAIKWLEALLKGNGFEPTPARRAALLALAPTDVLDLVQSLFEASGLNATKEPPKETGGEAPLPAPNDGEPG